MIEVNQIKELQKAWAHKNGYELDNDNYVKDMNKNFFSTLNEDTIRDLKGGNGSEIKDEKTRTKIFATHSSSALACNVFDYWRTRDKKLLSKSLELKKGIKSLCFEQKLSMGMQGTMPNLDVFMILDNGQAVAIESKFTEWMSKKSKSKPFADSYLENNAKRWTDLGLPQCQDLVENIVDNKKEFKYLDAPQLLKHSLGLANMHSSKSMLIYLYFEIENSPVAEAHQKEIKDFKKKLDGELNFTVITYQAMFEIMEKNRTELDTDYIKYLQNRYFKPVQS